jgi:hypothetical protein
MFSKEKFCEIFVCIDTCILHEFCIICFFFVVSYLFYLWSGCVTPCLISGYHNFRVTFYLVSSAMKMEVGYSSETFCALITCYYNPGDHNVNKFSYKSGTHCHVLVNTGCKGAVTWCMSTYFHIYFSSG